MNAVRAAFFTLAVVSAHIGPGALAYAPTKSALVQQPSTPETGQPSQMPADPFIRNAITVLQTIEAGGAAQIYDAASAAMRDNVVKDRFVNEMASSKARVGVIVSREWTRIEQLQVRPPSTGGRSTVPLGLYLTVFVVARDAQGAAHLEQVSFRFDEDRQWRLSGVVIRPPEQRRK